MPIPRAQKKIHLRDRHIEQSKPECTNTGKMIQNDMCAPKVLEPSAKDNKLVSTSNVTDHPVDSQSTCSKKQSCKGKKPQCKSTQEKSKRAKETCVIPVVESVKTGLKKNNVDIKLSGTDQAIPALIDTGADISCMSLTMFNQYFSNTKVSVSKHPQVKGVSGQFLKVIGAVTAQFYIKSQVFYQTLHIIEGLSRDFILGQDFLQTHQAIISFHPSSNKLQLCAQPKKDPSGTMQLVSSVSLPPRCQVQVNVQVRKGSNPDPSEVLLAPLPSVAGRFQIMGARCFSKLAQGKGVYLILNPNHYTVKLKKGTAVARFDSVDPESVIEESTDLDVSLHTVEKDPVPMVNTASTQEEGKSEEHCLQIAKDLGFNLDDSDLDQEQKRQLLIMLGQNRDVFATSLQELGSTDLHYHRIDTGDAPPVKQRPYRVSPDKNAEIERQVQEMSDAKLIEPSMSEWQSPVVLVKKKNGTYRFAIDYRKLNLVTKPISFPLPRIEDVFDSVGKAKARLFSVLDMASGYWQIPLDPETAHKTTFVTHGGVYSFKKLPFGLMNAPSCFSMVMSEVLRGLTLKYALVYVDDILVYSPNFQHHLDQLQEVFNRLRSAGLKLKPQKCKFAAKKVNYLGHDISSSGVEMETAKLQAVESFPVPKSQKQVRSFIGLCNYYRRFVRDFAKIAKPLNNLTKKDTTFKWTEECQEAFITLKKALTSEPIILKYPDWDRPFTLYCDASDYALGYILGQVDEQGRERVIAYAGRSLSEVEQKWHITEKECLAIIQGIKHFKVYLADKEFTILTDHKALEYLKKATDSSGKLHRWAIALQQYKYVIKHRSGSTHSNADALSRRTYDTVAPVISGATAGDGRNAELSFNQQQDNTSPSNQPTEYHLTYAQKPAKPQLNCVIPY